MLLGLDLGTTNIKALVADDVGHTLGQASCPVQLFHVNDGGVEQDIEEIWKATVSAIQQATRALKAGDIGAVGVSSQGGALQMLDGHGKPLGRVVSWLDPRGRRYSEALTTELGEDWFAQHIKHRGAGVAIGQLLRLRQETPGWLAAPNRVGFVGDEIVRRLCGHAAHDGTSASLTLLYDPATRAYDPDLLQRLGICAQQLPKLLQPRLASGGISPEVARATGLRTGIPVSPAIHDQYAAALGTGAVQPGTVMIGAGTAWVLLAVSERLAEPVTPNAFVCHHVVEGLHGQIVSLVNGGSALAWALDLVGQPGDSAAQTEALLASASAGSDGLRCWPFLASAPVAGLAPGTKGRLTGLQLSHRPAHVVRATVEGLAFELNRHLLLERSGGIPVDRLVMAGSAAASRVTSQIMADVTGLPLTCYSEGAGSSLGAAILARGLLEPGRSLAELARNMGKPAAQVRPGPDVGLYSSRFEEYLRELPLAAIGTS